MQVPQEFFVARVRDIERHKKSEAVLLSRKFSDPLRMEDLADLTLLPEEVGDLKTCRPGQCNLKLSSQQMEFIQGHVDFSEANVEKQANSAMRSLLLDYARDYQEHGNNAMIVYADKGSTVQCSGQFLDLLDESSNVFARARVR